jgi:hypothetical protein
MFSKSFIRWFSLTGTLLLACLLLLAACGGGTTSGNNTASATSTPTSGVSPTPTQDPNHISLAQLIGTPTAKITSGANFEVTGKVKNLDTLQHDIHLKATLTASNGQVVGTAIGLADDVHGGTTATYTLQGTATQPTWANVSVVITKVTENVDGQGTD